MRKVRNADRSKSLVRERLGDARADARPVTRARLTEQPRGRIPGAVIALTHPAKVGLKRQQDPYRLSERAGEMRCRTVDRDHKIKQRDHGSEIDEATQLRAQW